MRNGVYGMSMVCTEMVISECRTRSKLSWPLFYLSKLSNRALVLRTAFIPHNHHEMMDLHVYGWLVKLPFLFSSRDCNETQPTRLNLVGKTNYQKN